MGIVAWQPTEQFTSPFQKLRPRCERGIILRPLRETLLCSWVTLTCAFIGRIALHKPAATSEEMENKAFKCPRSINPTFVKHKGSMNRSIVLVAILALVAGFALAQLGPSNRACVTGALEKDRHAFQHRFDPPLLCSSHKSPGIIGHVGHTYEQTPCQNPKAFPRSVISIHLLTSNRMMLSHELGCYSSRIVRYSDVF
jgi:hypothetical protein